MIQGEAAASGKNYCDATFVDAKIIRDTTFYKNIIKRLKDELEKMKSENEKLRETVVAYSIKLPQVSMKLNTLVTCLEARVYKLNRLKRNRTKDDGGDSPSSPDSSLSGEDDRGCDELRDDGSEEDVGQTIQAPTNTGRHHSVQNFVEVICEEESSIGDAIISRGCVQNETLRDSHHEEGKNKVDNTVENNVKSLLGKTTAGHPHRQISIAQEKVHTSKANHAKHSVVKRKTKRKKSLIHDKYHPSHQAEKSNGASKDCKPLPKPLLVDEDASIIKIEESHDGNAVVANKVADKSKGSKFGMKLHKSVISMGSNLEAVNASNSKMGENTSNLCRRGRKRAYDCEVCGRTFARSSNLAHHVMRHRNERPHRCEICDRAFVQKANLKVHLRSHTGERPFSCPECGRAFAQKNNALRHLRAHVRQRQLQEQKLVCPVCAKSFGRWPSYETHMRRAHGSSESNSMVQMTHSMVEGMVNSPLSGGSSQSQEINIGNPHPVVGIPHHTGNAMAGSPVGPPHVEHVHSPSMPLVNAHPSDAISSVPLPTSHHSQTDHVVVSNTMDAQLSARHGCGDSAC